jgi:hypothetical protein
MNPTRGNDDYLRERKRREITSAPEASQDDEIDISRPASEYQAGKPSDDKPQPVVHSFKPPASVTRKNTAEKKPDYRLGKKFRVGFAGFEVESHTLVIDCSDGRFRQAVARFMAEHLRVDVYYEISIPGGPVRATLNGEMFFAVQADMKKLAKVHPIDRVIGIAHFDCAYYKGKYPKLDPEAIRSLQLKDLLLFKKEVPRIVRDAAIELYYASGGEDPHQAVFQEIVI